jgi:hypothetical protein
VSEPTVKVNGLIDGANVFAAFQVIASLARLGFLHFVDSGLNLAGAAER